MEAAEAVIHLAAVCYPTVVFSGNEVVFAFDYGSGVNQLERVHATKIKIVPLDWLYSK